MGDDLTIRDRVWYKGAEKSGVDVVYVSSPYVDYFTGETCFSVSMMLKDGRTIVGLDYDLSDMQACVEFIDDNMNGDAFNRQLRRQGSCHRDISSTLARTWQMWTRIIIMSFPKSSPPVKAIASFNYQSY